MDYISLIFSLMAQNPQATSTLIDRYNTPGQIDSVQLQSSLADFSMETLKCYHRTARFRGVDVLGSPWNEQYKYGAQGSVVLRIYFSGIIGTKYSMDIAAMAKPKNYRTFVIGDKAVVPYNKNCSLERWVSSEQLN